MRIVRMEFERLLGLRDVSIEVDPALQLIAGPNNAGKSSLIALMELFFSDPSDKDVLRYRPQNAYYTNEGPRALSRVTMHFGHLTPEESKLFGPIVRQRDHTFSISLRASRKGTITLEASKKPGAEDSRHYYNEVISRFHFVKIPSIRMADGKVGETDSLERLLDTLEAVLVRKGTTRSTALQQQFADRMSPVEALVREVLDHSAAAIQNDLPFQETTVSFRLPDPRHALRGMLAEAEILSSGSVQLPVAKRGTGFQSALVLGILRYVAQKESQSGANVYFAIEEPEAFLHPQTQRAMAKIIQDISADAQVLVTTHSAVLVDSFSVDRIARLPLEPAGMKYRWTRHNLEPADVGRLNRYCSAANSELVFASAVIFVEGEGDFAVLEKLLSRQCGGPGAHYALGITVIQASGISKIRHLVRLANLFGVRSYVLADRDSLHKVSGARQLIDIIKERSTPPDALRMSKLRDESDKPSTSLRTALARQKTLNQMLEPYDAFVLAADLEGLLLDMYGLENLAAALGPEGHNAIDREFEAQLLTAPDGHKRLAEWLGSKGWNSDSAKTGKLQPHLPAILIEEWLGHHANPGSALQPLIDWLSAIVSKTSLTPV